MSVFSFNKFKNYTIISNLVLTDENLSLEEKGLFCYLFSKPNGWEFHYNAMKKELKEKSDKTIRKILNRLVETGYITKCQANLTKGEKREDSGQFGGINIQFTNKSWMQEEGKNADSANLSFGKKTECPNLPNGKNGESVKMSPNNTDNNNNTYPKSTTNNNTFSQKDKYWYIEDTTDSYHVDINTTDQKVYESFKEILENKKSEKSTQNTINSINIPKNENNAKKQPLLMPETKADHSKQVKKFIKPTIEQIKQFAQKEQLQFLDANSFYDYYESKGWIIGKNSPMKNWCSAARNWNRRQIEYNQKKKINTQKQNKNQFVEMLKEMEQGE